MSILVLGASHRTAPVELREALSFGAEEAAALQRQMLPGLAELVLLSTCNRTEFYARADHPAEAEPGLRALVLGAKGRDLLAPGPGRYRFEGDAAVTHLFRVAAGLDSSILGEAQILGQVRQALAVARDAGSAGLVLGHLFDCAVRTGRRARSETAIGAGALSVAAAAVERAIAEAGNVEGFRAVVVGSGDTGRLVALQLAKRRPLRLHIVNRSLAHAEAVAREVGGEAHGLDELEWALAQADILVCAARAPAPLVTANAVRRAMQSRLNTRLVALDVGVPRNVEPGVASIENVCLISIDGLPPALDAGQHRRRAEIPRVDAIVEEESASFSAWRRALRAAPVVRELREHFERVREAELRRSLDRIAPAERARVEQLTRALVNKLLHLPTTRLKQLEMDDEISERHGRALRELFGLRPAAVHDEIGHG